MSAPLRQRGREGWESGRIPAYGQPHRADVMPVDVHDVLSRHLLVDGFPLVLDLTKSHGSWLVDARDGTELLDFYTFFASSPLGLNPPGLADDAEFLAELGVIAANKPANSDIATVELARFSETFDRVLGDPELPHLFFIEGGALAVENALKVAFDWKSRLNEAAGRSRELGTQVMHLRHAFHGRSGYTMSLTNTDPVKVDRFPKFSWPRIASPAISFPIANNINQLERAEGDALAEAEAAFRARPHDIACFIAEPIQGEGGDRHLRAEFLQAMQELCRRYDALFVLDEVQTGVGITGSPWCYEQLGLEPDVVAFGKKVQLGGVMAGRRVDEIADNVFRVPSRINSTWGGNLVDMVRSTRLLELIEETDAIANARDTGAHLLARVEALAETYPSLASNARGRGLMVALDVQTGVLRDKAVRALRENERVIALACGDRSIRFRPALSVTSGEIDHGCDALGRVLERMEASE
ncbi:MAG: L-lysine 6-transaminase [Acidimicrobiales bacterium]